MRIGYLVPEFPGQTHAFFWREIAALRNLGVEAETVSTRRPPSDIVCHEWSREAMARTHYLFPPGIKGVCRASRALLAAGPRAWARCVLAAWRGPTFRDKARFSALLMIGAQLAWLARARRWSHIHVHSCADAAMIALFASIVGGVPYSLTLHGRISDYGPAQDVKWREAFFGTTVTQTLKRELLNTVPGLDAGKVDVGAMGVDLAAFTRNSSYAAASGASVKLVSCGRLHPGKGHAKLIEAVALLRKRGIAAELAVLGEGPARAELESLVASLGLTQAVELPGAKSEREVREALERSHVFALASRDEAIGVATMEAMCMGLPVIVTGVGGVAELVRDGVDGLLVAPERADQVADAVATLMADPARAAAMGASGAARIRERFHSGVSAAVLAQRLGRTGVAAPGSAA